MERNSDRNRNRHSSDNSVYSSFRNSPGAGMADQSVFKNAFLLSLRYGQYGKSVLSCRWKLERGRQYCPFFGFGLFCGSMRRTWSLADHPEQRKKVHMGGSSPGRSVYHLVHPLRRAWIVLGLSGNRSNGLCLFDCYFNGCPEKRYPFSSLPRSITVYSPVCLWRKNA